MSICLALQEPNVLINFLANDKDWLVRVFWKTTVKHCNSAAFILQLLDCGILKIKLRKPDVLVELARDEADKYLYDKTLIWEVFQFRSSSSFFLTKVLRN